MEIYLLKADVSRYRGFEMCRSSDLDIAFWFNGQSLKSDWKPLQVRPIDDATNRELPYGDFPYITSFPILSNRAFACLEETLAPDAEFLPLAWGDQRLYAVNVTTVLDALDETRSRIDYLPSGPVAAIKKYTFIPEVVRRHRIFKIRQDKLVDVLVNEEVVKRIETCGLVGARVTPLWSAPGL